MSANDTPSQTWAHSPTHVQEDDDVFFDLDVADPAEILRTIRSMGAPNLDTPEFSRADAPSTNLLHQIVTERDSRKRHAPKTGDLIDSRYRVLKPLGSGSFGEVVLVEHTFLGQRFAMKLLHHKIAEDPTWVLGFYEEARATSLIGHENIVFITDFGRCPAYGYYFVMEHLDGQLLQLIQRAHRGRRDFPIERAVEIGLQVSNGLAAVHDIGIVHCDLKPANLMILDRSDGSILCKILDFGISNRVIGSFEGDPTIFGTPTYMAPEQTVTMEVSGRADQFSLATILYELLVGRLPWDIRHWDHALAGWRKTHPPALPSTLRADLNPTWDKVLMRALEINPARRWPDIQTFAHALVMASGIHAKPRADPRDASALPSTPQVVVSSPSAGESLMIVVDEVDMFDLNSEEESWLGAMIEVRFRTIERLRREWRRNLVSNTLFIPTDLILPPGREVMVQLILEPLQRTLQLHGEVMAASEDDGFGVSLPEASMLRLQHFLDELQLGLRHQPGDIIRPLDRDIMKASDLGMGEAYLISRISGPVRVVDVRAMMAGLPFDIDVCLWRLIDKGYLMVLPTNADPATTPQTHSHDPWLRQLSLTTRLAEVQGQASQGSEIQEVLEMVEFFREHHNYLSAMEVLYRGIDAFPRVAEFYHQLALLYAQFRNDLGRAFQALACATQLAPDEARFVMTYEYLQTLLGSTARASS